MKKQTLCEGKFRRFLCEQGWEFTERVDCTGIVAIIAVTEESKVLLIEQYRVPVACQVIEFPAGLVSDSEIHSGESLETAARRELLEETGYAAEQMIFFRNVPASAASCSDMISVYRAFGLKKVGAGGGDPTEAIIVHEVKIDEADAWLEERQARSGYLVDPKVYAGLYFLKNFSRDLRQGGS